MTELRGGYDERFAGVAQALADSLEGGDAGGSAAVFVGGEPVVDVWGGWGGGLVMIDPTQRLVVAYATNQMREPAYDERGMQIAMAALTAG